MYQWTQWYDEAVESPNNYLVNGQAATIVGNHGTVMQEGTPQSDENFNNIEDGIVDAHLAMLLVAGFCRQNAWQIERGSVTLTNSQPFPFNDSQKTVALATALESTDYIVLTDVAQSSGNVGEIVVSNRLTNGFKLSYTGSAANVTISYVVIGGYMK